MSEELREKIKDILNENIDNDANWNDGPNPEKVLEDLLTLISHERAEAVRGFETALTEKMIEQGVDILSMRPLDFSVIVRNVCKEYLSNERGK